MTSETETIEEMERRLVALREEIVQYSARLSKKYADELRQRTEPASGTEVQSLSEHMDQLTQEYMQLNQKIEEMKHT